jgi:MarR family transcriptional regulator, organic hydroperoxide resistance regulator
MNNTSITYVFTVFATKHRDNLDKLMKEIGLHGGQIFVLNLLWNNDGQSQAELVKQLNVSAPTVYNMVIRLAETGYIQIKKDKNDARIMRVYLTDQGLQIKTKVFEQWEKLENQTFANLTEPEKMMFSMLLQKIVEKPI